MAQLRSIALVALLALASTAFAAQKPAPPDAADAQASPPTTPDAQQTQDPDPKAASSPHQRDVTGQPTDESTPNATPDPAGASTPHQQGAVGQTPQGNVASGTPKLVGLQVQSPTGEAIGSVVDVTMDSSKQPEYAVISTGNDTMTAVPYSAVASMVKDNKVIMDRSRLQNSPQVAQSELRDKKNSKWRSDADRYWNSAAVREAKKMPGTTEPSPKER